MEQQKENSGFGTMIGIIIIVIVLLVGAYYFTKQRIEKSKEFQTTLQEGISTTTDETLDTKSGTSSIKSN